MKRTSKRRKEKPNTNGKNGSSKNRNSKGQFIKNNKAAVGHTTERAKKGKILKDLLLDCITEEDFKAIIFNLIEQAKSGDLCAIRELLDRCIGKPIQSVDIDAGENLQSFINWLCGRIGDGTTD